MGPARPRGAESGPLSEHVRAAGGVVVRDGDEGPEVLIVHRPRYDDWTFPKGKLEPGESEEEGALREVEEETGLRCALEQELDTTEYIDGRGSPKSVRYWRMGVVDGELRFDHEVDAARWASPAEAAKLLTYGRDVSLLDSL